MTLDETMIINNMTNVIKNLEPSKRICDITDDLNESILTLGGRKHDEPTETKPEQVEHVQDKTKDKTVMKPAAQPVAAQPAAVVPPAKPVKKLAKEEQVKTSTKTPAPGRGKIECRCGLMVCNAAMSRHELEKGAKHKEAMSKKEKTEMKQAEGQALGMSDMVKASGWQSFDRQFDPYPRAIKVAPLWCSLGCCSESDGRIHQ